MTFTQRLKYQCCVHRLRVIEGLCNIESDLWKTSGRGKELLQKDLKGLFLTTMINLRLSQMQVLCWHQVEQPTKCLVSAVWLSCSFNSCNRNYGRVSRNSLLNNQSGILSKDLTNMSNGLGQPGRKFCDTTYENRRHHRNLVIPSSLSGSEDHASILFERVSLVLMSGYAERSRAKLISFNTTLK